MGMKENSNDFFPMFDSDEPEEINEFISIFPADEDSSLTDTPIPENIPILPLRNTVLFPNLVVPITISRDKSIQLVNDVYATDRKIGVVAQKSQ
jgi:ATP-dependent Lon protease